MKYRVIVTIELLLILGFIFAKVYPQYFISTVAILFVVAMFMQVILGLIR